jgi:2-polyprenyl-3-methyl-5-hydroxy-6-metoxy-1,4-benzoquinol methylase
VTEDRLAHLTDRDLYERFYDADTTPGEFHPMFSGEPRLLWTLKHLRPHMDVVDLGCHKGEMTLYLRQATRGRVVGVDCSKQAIDEAAEFWEGRDIEWVRAFAEETPFPDASFDLACINEVLEHVMDPAAVIREAERIVRPGGLVVVSAPCDAVAMDLEEREMRDAVTGMKLARHVREYVPAEELAGKPRLKLQETRIGNVRFRMASYRVEA